jgi:uncharacterized protein
MPKRLLTIAGMLTLIMLVAGAATAQQTPQAEEMAAARELVITMRVSDQFKAIMPTLMKSISSAMLVGRSPEFVRDFEAASAKLMDAVQERSGQLNEILATVYASNFNAQELKDMTAFYRTPTGQKVLERMPEVMQQSMQAGQVWGNQIAVEIQRRLIEEMRKKGHNI